MRERSARISPLDWGLVCVFMALGAALAWTGPRLDMLPLAATLHTALFGTLLLLVFRHGAALDRRWLLLGGALVLRLLFLGSVPDLSVDPFRYLWDGWLTAEGGNPYRFTPSDPRLVERHGDLLFREMNSRDFYSIYPPFSQWLFAPAGAVYPHLGWPSAFFVLKGTIVLAELIGITLLHQALREEGKSARLLALYAWNPLVLVAVAGVGHSEGGLVLALGLLALGLVRQHASMAWVGMGLAIVSKGVPLLVAPLLLRHHLGEIGRGRSLRAAVIGLAPAVLLSLPFIFPGLPYRLASSADLYVRLFEFNAGLFAALRALLGPFSSGEGTAVLGPALRWGVLGAAGWVALRHPVKEGRQVLQGGLVIFGLYLVGATTVHPWYLLWGLPLVAFTTIHRAAWLWASWAGFLTYFAYVGVPEAGLAVIFWVPLLALVCVEELPRLRDAMLPWAGRRKADMIRPHLQGRTVLDLGAGEGWVGSHLSTGERQVYLADLEASFLTDRPAFVYDGRRLPLPDGSIDTVVLCLVLHHADSPERLLREALRVGRRVVITESTYRYEWERRLLDRADRIVNRGRGSGEMGRAEGPLHFDTVEGWHARAQAAGGRVVGSQPLNRVGHRHHLFVIEPIRT